VNHVDYVVGEKGATKGRDGGDVGKRLDYGGEKGVASVCAREEIGDGVYQRREDGRVRYLTV